MFKAATPAATLLACILLSMHSIAQTIPANPTVINFFDRVITYSNVSLQSSGKNYYAALPGEKIAISFNWIVNCNSGIYCPNCWVQLYWGTSYNGTTLFSNCFANKIFNPPCGQSGNVSSSFVAPTVPGIYYITQNFNLDYNCYPQGILQPNTLSSAFAVVLVNGVTWQKNGNNIYYNEGNVGINTMTPALKLDVNGSIGIKGKQVIDTLGRWVGDSTGIVGPAGKNGATWYSGTTNPSSTLGTVNDFYLNTSTDSVYKKQTTNWIGIAYLKGLQGITGPQGPQGTNGSVWFTGQANPPATTGSNNDFYLNTTTDSIFQKLNGTWRGVANIKGLQGTPGVQGPQGVPGTNGSVWYTANTNPPASTGNNNDLFLNSITDSLFQKQNGTWKGIANLKGAQGSQGPQGTQGPQGPTGPQGPQGPKGDPGPDCSVICTAAAATAGAAATAAGLSAGEASVSAGAAAASATAAAASAGEATVSAGEASASAVRAGTSATEASTSAEQASLSKTAAKNSADDAKQSETSSKQSADSSEYYYEKAKELMNGDAGGDLSGKYPNPTVSKIQGKAVSAASPANNQILKWINNAWTPADPDKLIYKAGTGIGIQTDSIYAKNNDALWNAGKLAGYSIDTTRPLSKQVLTWNGTKWTANNFQSGWIVDSTNKDTANVYAAVNGNVGIGTKNPKALLHIQGGKTQSNDSAFIVNKNGNVGIGVSVMNENYKLSVNGEILAKAVTVESDWADYVFDSKYSLLPLGELEKYINENKHLPGVPSAETIKEHGLNVGQTQKIMMAKIEELTLYLIELKKENERLSDEIKKIKTGF